VTSPLLRVDDLHVAFDSGRGRIEALRGVSLEVTAGRVLAIVGESGSGKSVLARTLVGLTGDASTVRAEALELSGRDVRSLSERQWRSIRGREIGFVLQDALVSLDPLRKVGSEIAEPLLTHGLSARREVGARVQALLEAVGVPEPEVRAAQRPGELSGGLRQRALIASALAADPALIIADEPTTALDVTVQAQVLALLGGLARDGRGVLVITHDLAVVSEIADDIVVMHDGVVVERGAAGSVLRDPQHEYTRRLLAAVPSAATRGARLSGARVASGAAAAAAAPAASPPRDAAASGPVLDVRDISVHFRGPDGKRRMAVDDVSFRLDRGETLGLVGESGSGKTTIGRVALALQQADSGEVTLDGEPWSTVSEARRRPRRGRIQVVSQDPLGSFAPQATVESLLRQPLRLRRDLAPGQRRAESLRLLALVGLGEEFLRRRPRTLSGGQRQRVSIAQALAASPDVLVCDEPVSALDVSTQAQVLDLLVDLQRELGLALLFISHDLGVVQHLSHRVIVLKNGRIVEQGDIDDVFSRPRHDYTKTLVAAVPTVEAVAAVAVVAVVAGA
jgi:peptide/nickel transport system ATP-binding protein